jgi:hypothetical protein
MEKFAHNKYIEIAEFSIHLFSNTAFELEEGYWPFEKENETEIAADFKIECILNLPDELPFDISEPVFEAENEQQKFYSIYRVEQGLGIVIYNQQDINQIQQIAILDESYRNWKIYNTASANGFLPMKYPMGPILMHYITMKTNAVMMHASCAYDGVKARIFTGFSGAGKSTMSMIWAKAGHQIINDDRLIVRKKGDGFYVYNTPMYYQDIPKKAHLNSIFLISHSPENKIKKLNGALAVSRVMAFSIQNNFDRQFINSRIDLFSEIANQVSIYELGFVPDEQVVQFVLANES